MKNDSLVKLINTPDVSMYSIGEDLGVGRIINYGTLCNCLGLIPQTFNKDEQLTDLDMTNFIVEGEDN